MLFGLCRGVLFSETVAAEEEVVHNDQELRCVSQLRGCL
jgi:hypothetical protein